jgi:hypothetical protein
MAAMVVILGGLAVYFLRPEPQPADLPDFSWVPTQGPSAP